MTSVASLDALREYLDTLVNRHERPAFIDDDPISIPHAFDDPRDQEVIGLYAALLAWGRRDVMLRKLEELCERMNHAPYRFVRTFNPDSRRDAAALDDFVHRTFQPIDAIWLTTNLRAALEATRRWRDSSRRIVPTRRRTRRVLPWRPCSRA